MKSAYLVLLFLLTNFACKANDLDMFRLSGPVDSVCIIMNDAGLEWQTEFTFDTNGILDGIDGEEIDCIRDDNGRITSITLIDAAEDDEESFTTIEMNLFYDNAGRVIRTTGMSADEQWSQRYIYDTNGLLKERTYDIVGEEEIQSYLYLKFDEYGNWTERLEKLQSMDQTIRQIRHITYRQ